LFRRPRAPSKSGHSGLPPFCLVVAVTPRDRRLRRSCFAVDGQQNIIAADRHGRAMMSADLPVQGI